MSAGRSIEATFTNAAKELAADDRFITPGNPPPTPLWQPEQIGPKYFDCNWVNVAAAGGGGAVLFTVIATAVEVVELPGCVERHCSE